MTVIAARRPPITRRGGLRLRPLEPDVDTPYVLETVRTLDPAPSHAILDEGERNLVRSFPAFGRMQVAERWAGVDVAQATADLKTHQQSIDALLARNNAQAEAFGFQATPAFIVGTFRVPGVLSMAAFKQVIADARAAGQKH